MYEDNGWNEHSKLVLNELKRLNERLDSLECHLESKLDRTILSLRADSKTLDNQITQLKIDIAVLQKEVAIKSMMVAFGASLLFSILNVFFK